jgi:hypothetical protein
MARLKIMATAVPEGVSLLLRVLHTGVLLASSGKQRRPGTHEGVDVMVGVQVMVLPAEMEHALVVLGICV